MKHACHSACLEDHRGEVVTDETVEEMNTGLSKCPFCGESGKGLMILEQFDGYYVRCDECGCQTSPAADIHRVVRTWNRRADQ